MDPIAEIASAFVTIAPSARGFGSKLNSEVGGAVRSSGSSLGATFGKLFALGAGVIAAAGIGNLLRGSIDEAREAQKVSAQTEAVLKSTGGVANVTAGQIDTLAASLSAKIGVDDEAIQAGENMLLTFTKVRNEVGKGNDIFNQATVVAQDMAAAFGGDAVSNSKILGKALNDPVKGISALTRVGVQFTDKQKDQIETLVKSGNVMGAQKIILGELTKQTKGSAEAQATAGDKARVAFDNLKETIGTALLPVIDRLSTIFTTKVAPAITTFVAQLQSGEGVGGRVAAVFSTVASVLSTLFGFINQNRAVTAVFVGSIVAMTVAFAAFNLVVSANPISLVIIAIAALAAGLVYAYKNSEKFRAVVDAVFGFISKYVPKVVSFVVNFVKSHWVLLVTLIGGPIALAVIQVVKHWDKIKAVFLIALSIIKPIVKNAFEVIRGYFQTAVAAWKTIINNAWDAIKGAFQAGKRAVTTVAGNIRDAVSAAFGAIKSAVDGVIDRVQWLIDKIGALISKIKSIPTGPIGAIAGALGRTAEGGGVAGGGVVGVGSGVKGVPSSAHRGIGDDGRGLHDEVRGLRQDVRALAGQIGATVGQEVNGAASSGRRRSLNSGKRWGTA